MCVYACVFTHTHAYRCSCMWSRFSYIFGTDPMDCRLPGSSVHGTLQAIILECVFMPSSRRSSWHRDGTLVSVSPVFCIGRWLFTCIYIYVCVCVHAYVYIWSAEPAMLANYAWASKIRPGRPQCLLSFGRTERRLRRGANFLSWSFIGLRRKPSYSASFLHWVFLLSYPHSITLYISN